MKNQPITILFLVIILVVTIAHVTRAETEELKLYITNNTLYYKCPDGPMEAPKDLNIDINSIAIINNNFFKDKNNVYRAWEDGHSYFCGINKITDADPETFIFYSEYFQKDKNNVFSNSNYWGWGTPRKITYLNIDPHTFESLGGYYAKDKNNVYIFTFENNGKVKIVEKADVNTFEVLSEDNNYGMDKNNMYFHGEILSQQADEIINTSLYSGLKGKIILNVDSNGEAYYISPKKQEMHFLSRPVVAFYVMREQGVGITNKDLEKIPVADNYCPAYLQYCDKKNSHNIQFAAQQKGKIFIQVEGNGEAWYVNPINSKRYYLGRPIDAFNVMRNLGLGINNQNFLSLTSNEFGSGKLMNDDENKAIDKWYFVSLGTKKNPTKKEYSLVINDKCTVSAISIQDESCLKYLSTNKNTVYDGYNGPSVSIYGTLLSNNSIQVSDIILQQ